MYVRLDLGRYTVDCWASAAVLACCLARKEAGRRCENLAAPSLRMWVPVLLVGPLRLELYGEGRPDARAPCRVRAWLQSAWLGLGLGLGLANPNPTLTRLPVLRRGGGQPDRRAGEPRRPRLRQQLQPGLRHAPPPMAAPGRTGRMLRAQSRGSRAIWCRAMGRCAQARAMCSS